MSVVDDSVESIPFYPMPRERPFDPPQSLLDIQSGERVQRVRIWDGSTPWLVTGFELCRQVLGDPRVSSDTESMGFPAVHPGYSAQRRVVKSFINLDNPEHDALRRALTPDFTWKRVEQMRAKIQELVDDLIDSLLAGPRPVDLVPAFASQLATLLTCEILAVPLKDRDWFSAQADVVNAHSKTEEEMADARRAMNEYFLDLVDRRLANPGDDLVSRVAQAQIPTGKLTRDQVASACNSVLIGGFDTTRNMISISTVAFLQNPDVLTSVRETADPALIANSVEEMLRWSTILHLGRRRAALQDMEIDGHLVRAGEGIIVAHDAADRDPAAFPDPDVIDIRRKARHHLAFGYGAHQCLGQALARVELQVVFSTLFRRIPTLKLAVPFAELKFRYDSSIFGLYELPITW